MSASRDRLAELGEHLSTLAIVRNALLRDPVRIEVSNAYNFTQGGVQTTANLFVKSGTRWQKSGPFIVPSGDTLLDRAQLFRDLATIIDTEIEETS